MPKPGEWLLSDEPVEINAGRRTLKMKVRNTGDRPVQVGSHYHFFEANSALDFDRPQAMGMRLNVPGGQAARFEPGDEKEVELVEYGGAKRVYGFNKLIDGGLTAHWTVQKALERARDLGFKGMGGLEREKADVIQRQAIENQGVRVSPQDHGPAKPGEKSGEKGPVKSEGKTQGGQEGQS